MRINSAYMPVCFDIDFLVYQRVHSARPVNSNSLAFLVTGIYVINSFLSHSFRLQMLTSFAAYIYKYILLFFFFMSVLLLFMILNSHQMSANFLVFSLILLMNISFAC